MINPTELLKTLWARHLSRKGKHTEALNSNMQDIYVLASAGMYISILENSREPSIEHAMALSQTGRIEAALEMALRFTPNSTTKTLLGFLATLEPEKVASCLPHKREWLDIQAYCACTTGDLKQALNLVNHVSPLHALYIWLHAKKSDKAQQCFAKFFEGFGMTVPLAEWNGFAFDFKSLQCYQTKLEIPENVLISIILTALNEEVYLPIAAKSILQQDWKNIELIIVDDGSTDRTLAIAHELSESDKRVRVLHLSENVGTWRAKNIALSKTNGDFITMHDADDWSHPSKLSSQLIPLLRDKNLMCSSSSFFRVDEKTGIPYSRNANSFLRWNPSSTLFRSEVIDKIGFFREDLLGADCEFTERIELHWGIKSHKKIRKPLAIGLNRHSSLSNRHRLEEDCIRIQDWERWRREHMQFSQAKNRKTSLIGPVSNRNLRK